MATAPVPVKSQSTSFAVTSLVTGIAGLVLIWVPIIGFVLSILGVVFGALGVRRSVGKGMALAGLITGVVGVGIWVLLFLIGVAAGVSGTVNTY